MRRVHIVLEGSKDVYFLYVLLVRRFAFASTKKWASLVSGNVSLSQGETLSCHEADLDVCLYWTDGVANVEGQAKNLLRPVELLDADTFAAALIVDADSQDPPGTPADRRTYGGIAERPGWLIGKLKEKAREEVQKDERYKELATFSRDCIFLLPDNQREGDLETLMRDCVNRADPNHETFFTACWAGFDASLKAHNFNPATRKSMMNEYAAAFDAHTWDHNGINRTLFNDSLWDWHAPALAPLVAFLDTLFFGTSSPINTTTTQETL